MHYIPTDFLKILNVENKRVSNMVVIIALSFGWEKPRLMIPISSLRL